MTLALLFILGGLALLYVGAEGLVRGSAGLALRVGLTPLVVGLTVVAFGTSSPELVVSLSAALEGQGALAIGNVVGSNISNFALILGVTALIRPVGVEVQLIRLDIPLVIGASVLLALLLLDGGLGRIDGLLLTGGIVAYTLFTLRQARQAPTEERTVFEEVPQEPQGSAWRDALFAAGGLAVLVLGGRLLVSGAVTVAEALGMSEATIGLTVVAVGTSLPELATSVVAALGGKGDLAVGNVVGSNLFNVLGILGVAALVRPLGGAGIGLLDLGVMVGLAVLMLPLMRSGFQLSRREGLLLLLIYAAYVGWLLVNS